MWEMFSLKLPNTTEEESRSALMLLRMAAEAEMNIMTDNLNVLVKVGLGPRAQTDLLLARDTCRAILAVKQEDCSKNIDKSPIRYVLYFVEFLIFEYKGLLPVVIFYKFDIGTISIIDILYNYLILKNY